MPIRNDSSPVVIAEIHEYLNLSKTNCCLFEDATQKAGDFWINSKGIAYEKFNTEDIYYFFGAENNNLDNISDAFWSSCSYVFLCAFSNLDVEEPKKFIPFTEITVELMKLFVKNVNAIIVRAYDREGYLIWMAI